MVILDTSFSCIKIPIENYSWFLFFTSHYNYQSIINLITYCICNASGYFSLFCLSIIEYLIS